MLPYLFVLLAIAVRFLPFLGPLNVLPHAWHFTPVAASLLFFGARGSRRQMWIPLVLFAATDIILTKFIYSYALSWDILVTFAWYAAILWLGTNLREKSGPAARDRRCACQFSFIFPDQQFCRVGGMVADVSPILQRPDDVLRRRHPVFPRDRGKRFVLLYRNVRHARIPACPVRLVRQNRGSHRCRINISRMLKF